MVRVLEFSLTLARLPSYRRAKIHFFFSAKKTGCRAAASFAISATSSAMGSIIFHPLGAGGWPCPAISLTAAHSEWIISDREFRVGSSDNPAPCDLCLPYITRPNNPTKGCTRQPSPRSTPHHLSFTPLPVAYNPSASSSRTSIRWSLYLFQLKAYQSYRCSSPAARQALIRSLWKVPFPSRFAIFLSID